MLEFLWTTQIHRRGPTGSSNCLQRKVASGSQENFSDLCWGWVRARRKRFERELEICGLIGLIKCSAGLSRSSVCEVASGTHALRRERFQPWIQNLSIPWCLRRQWLRTPSTSNTRWCNSAIQVVAKAWPEVLSQSLIWNWPDLWLKKVILVWSNWFKKHWRIGHCVPCLHQKGWQW